MTRVRAKAMGLAILLALGGCTAPTADQLASMEWPALRADLDRAYAFTYQDFPFTAGAISVVATEQGVLRTYRLVPCRGGTAICAGSSSGPVGSFDASAPLDYTVVRGLYGGTFYLSPGGDGGLRRAGQPDVHLAWHSVEP